MATSADLAAATTALREGRWEAARSLLAPLVEGEATADALEAMAEACWWLCDARASVRYRERAWLLLRGDGELVRAGRAALDLSIAYLVNLGNDAAARGWLRRAERVLGDVDPNPLQGWLWLMQGYTAGDPDTAHALVARALAFGQASGDVDLELVALSDLGLALVVSGRVDDGVALLDEAMAGTVAGEYRRLDTVVFATCSMLAACHLVGDLDRASKWCRAADEFMATYGCPFLYARCRTHYGGVLVAAGQWSRAEQELQAALAMAEDAGPGPRLEAIAQLADLRLRQGRVEEAEALLDLAGATEQATLAAAALRLARGEPSVAAGLLERRARLLGDHHIERPAILAVLVDAQLAQGELEAAASTLALLSEVAALQDRDAAYALAAVAAAHVAIALSRPDEAIAALEAALGRLDALALPLDTARVRLDLARQLAAGRRQLAAAEARAALATFERLGAAADAEDAASVLRSVTSDDPAGAAAGDDLLTRREQEVLALVAAGLSNPEIAARLYISRKTASNHVSNILTKLGLRNRAEAVAYSVRHRSGPHPIT